MAAWPWGTPARQPVHACVHMCGGCGSAARANMSCARSHANCACCAMQHAPRMTRRCAAAPSPAPRRLATPLGICSVVGAGGLALNGGISLLSRAYGATADNILEATLVLADGSVVSLHWLSSRLAAGLQRGGEGVVPGWRLRMCSVSLQRLCCSLPPLQVNVTPSSDPELHWAMRGAGEGGPASLAIAARLAAPCHALFGSCTGMHAPCCVQLLASTPAARPTGTRHCAWGGNQDQAAAARCVQRPLRRDGLARRAGPGDPEVRLWGCVTRLLQMLRHAAGFCCKCTSRLACLPAHACRLPMASSRSRSLHRRVLLRFVRDVVLPNPAIGFNIARATDPQLGPLLVSMVSKGRRPVSCRRFSLCRWRYCCCC